MTFLNLPPSMIDVLPDYRPATPPSARKVQQRQHKLELYRADPERYRARRRVTNLSARQVHWTRLLQRRKYVVHGPRIREAQARRDRARRAAERILRAVLAILDGQPVRMRNRASKYQVGK